MVDNRQRLAAHARTGQADLDHLAPARDDGEIDRLVHRLQRWCRELIALGDAHDPVMLNFHIVRPTREETVRMWEFYDGMRPDQRGLCNYVEAALGRLNAYLRQPDTRPKGKGGNRRQFDDGPIVEEARAIYAKHGRVNKMDAVRRAKLHHPKLFHLRGMGPDNVESAIKRISRKI